MKEDIMRYERSANMMVAEMDGDLVMMDIDQGSYFAINPVGGHLWQQLETPQTLAGLVESVTKAFATDDASQVKTDVEGFLADMAHNNLIREIRA
ncbi:PqqD family protein [Rhodobacteraceae bacterium N5(2021)]|uniref:PqqD family protein n=1 Tax=Gymnodinialimonas phycosphaerae TaxID=2841589 RepID=A0A975TX92_9RHOB|nr:PqqD family protein [Gymnodinialimonas phycosphaerae]MBY4891626.1 PqqD family protein [Gymnodinialimonas phycosphaerae]